MRAGERIGLALVTALCGACHSGSDGHVTSAPPAYVRENGLITVPEGSELRAALVVGSSLRQIIRAPLRAPAVLEADPAKVANILPPLSGRIAALYVHLGDRVQAGQPLFTIDSADLAQARADLQKARAALTLTRKALERTRDLLQHGIAAQKDEEQAASDYASAQSEYDRAAAVFTTFGIPLQNEASARRLTLRSPVAGRVSMLNAVPGTFANDNTAALMTIADVSTIWFTASVQEKDLASVRSGEEVAATTQSYPGETFHGWVAFVADQLESDTRTVKVRMAYPNSDGRLKPGMFANVTFLGTPREAVLVPTSALIQNDARTEVFVEVAPWKFEARAVTVGARVADNTELLTGLEGGERVVTAQGVLLND